MTTRAERKRLKRVPIEREQRLARKRTALEEARSLIHHDGPAYDLDDRVGAVLVDDNGRVIARRVDPPASWEHPGARSLDPHLTEGHPRSGEVVSVSSRALIRAALDPRISGVLPETIRDVARDRLLDGA